MDLPKLFTELKDDVAILWPSFRVYSGSDEVDNWHFSPLALHAQCWHGPVPCFAACCMGAHVVGLSRPLWAGSRGAALLGARVPLWGAGSVMEADFQASSLSCRKWPSDMKSMCMYVYINTMRFDQGIHKHSAFNYRSCSTGMWETAEEKVIVFICVFHCWQAQHHYSTRQPVNF